MPEFSYKARRRSGELVEGVLEVADRPAALAQIKRLGLFPIAVDANKGGAAVNGKRSGQKLDLMAFLPPTLRAQIAAEAQTEIAGAGDVHATTGEFASGRNAVDGGAQQHDASGVEGHSRRCHARFETGSHRGQRFVRRDGEAAAHFFGFVYQHGARGRAERFARGSVAAHGESFQPVRRGAGEIHLRADLSGDGDLRRHFADRFFMTVMMPKFIDHF